MCCTVCKLAFPGRNLPSGLSSNQNPVRLRLPVRNGTVAVYLVAGRGMVLCETLEMALHPFLMGEDDGRCVAVGCDGSGDALLK